MILYSGVKRRFEYICRSGGIGRRSGLRSLWMWVRVGSSPIFCTTSSRTLYRSWRLFLLKKPSLTHAVVPPFRNRSRSSRLFGCKRPHDGFVSLPPCFGWGGISKFDLCLFILRLHSNRLFSCIRLAVSSIASQWYTAFSRVILPNGS